MNVKQGIKKIQMKRELCVFSQTLSGLKEILKIPTWLLVWVTQISSEALVHHDKWDHPTVDCSLSITTGEPFSHSYLETSIYKPTALRGLQ